MASSQKCKNLKTREFRDIELEDRDQNTMFDVFYVKMREVCAGVWLHSNGIQLS